MQAGYAGKLPAYGDFVEGGGSVRARQDWSAWAERGLAAARDRVGGGFPDIFLTSPIWRFAVADGVFGAAPVAGVFCPSMDKVGRLFPFSVVVDLPQGVSPMAACAALGPWFDQMEAAVLAALDASATLEGLSGQMTDPDPIRGSESAQLIAQAARLSPLNVTPEGAPILDGGDALDLSDAEPEQGDGLWITLGGMDDGARGIMQHGAADDTLFATLVTGDAAHGA